MIALTTPSAGGVVFQATFHPARDRQFNFYWKRRIEGEQPSMRLQIKFEVEVPDDMPFDAAREWIAFEVNARSDMTPRHPQMNHDVEPVDGTFFVRFSPEWRARSGPAIQSMSRRDFGNGGKSTSPWTR